MRSPHMEGTHAFFSSVVCFACVGYFAFQHPASDLPHYVLHIEAHAAAHCHMHRAHYLSPAGFLELFRIDFRPHFLGFF